MSCLIILGQDLLRNCWIYLEDSGKFSSKFPRFWRAVKLIFALIPIYSRSN